MTDNLSNRIYRAQTLGNVEPIEYMTPYPNLHALVEGQNVKHHGKMIYADLGMTNLDFYTQVQKIANWLVSTGLKPKERVWIHPQQFPHTEFLVFAVWTVGASVILVEDPSQDIDHIIMPDRVIKTDPIPDCLKHQEDTFDPTFKPNLNDEALIFISTGKGIRLSHYNLLVNANDVQRKLNLYDDGKFHVELKPNSTAWVVLQAIFPLYTGAPVTKENPDLTIGHENADYNVNFDWTEIIKKNQLYILPENTAVVSVGTSGLPMTILKQNGEHLSVEGHSVMMGYTDDELNEKVFKKGALNLQLNQ
ncbi:MAG: hypothetical protein CMF79_00315 [Candidatus Marinimicrobia bacterium]|nr:hypothetical protein [Candidatus Neomarinimicrobiota bacterium]